MKWEAGEYWSYMIFLKHRDKAFLSIYYGISYVLKQFRNDVILEEKKFHLIAILLIGTQSPVVKPHKMKYVFTWEIVYKARSLSTHLNVLAPVTSSSLPIKTCTRKHTTLNHVHTRPIPILVHPTLKLLSLFVSQLTRRSVRSQV